ncbi:MAG: hypothetical protein WBV36_04675 [Terriglobales bacterium]
MATLLTFGTLLALRIKTSYLPTNGVLLKAQLVRVRLSRLQFFA